MQKMPRTAPAPLDKRSASQLPEVISVQPRAASIQRTGWTRLAPANLESVRAIVGRVQRQRTQVQRAPVPGSEEGWSGLAADIPIPTKHGNIKILFISSCFAVGIMFSKFTTSLLVALTLVTAVPSAYAVPMKYLGA